MVVDAPPDVGAAMVPPRWLARRAISVVGRSQCFLVGRGATTGGGSEVDESEYILSMECGRRSRRARRKVDQRPLLATRQGSRVVIWREARHGPVRSILGGVHPDCADDGPRADDLPRARKREGLPQLPAFFSAAVEASPSQHLRFPRPRAEGKTETFCAGTPTPEPDVKVPLWDCRRPTMISWRRTGHPWNRAGRFGLYLTRHHRRPRARSWGKETRWREVRHNRPLLPVRTGTGGLSFGSLTKDFGDIERLKSAGSAPQLVTGTPQVHESRRRRASSRRIHRGSPRLPASPRQLGRPDTREAGLG